MIRIVLCVTKLEKYISQRYYLTGSSRSYSIMEKSFAIESAKSCIPPLDNKNHKGQAGRIGIVGGSLEYTGAPYFAGISALKVSNVLHSCNVIMVQKAFFIFKQSILLSRLSGQI